MPGLVLRGKISLREAWCCRYQNSKIMLEKPLTSFIVQFSHQWNGYKIFYLISLQSYSENPMRRGFLGKVQMWLPRRHGRTGLALSPNNRFTCIWFFSESSEAPNWKDIFKFWFVSSINMLLFFLFVFFQGRGLFSHLKETKVGLTAMTRFKVAWNYSSSYIWKEMQCRHNLRKSIDYSMYKRKDRMSSRKQHGCITMNFEDRFNYTFCVFNFFF